MKIVLWWWIEMLRHLGYACINETLRPKTFRSCRLKSVREKGISYLQEIIWYNLDFLHEILSWNIAHEILFYRVSSDLLPLVTHPDVIESGYKWDEDSHTLDKLAMIKQLVHEHGIRISMHPDQYTVLNSPKEAVYRNSVIYLDYHATLLALLGGRDMILHIGGVYGDKATGKKRFILRYKLLNDTIKGYLRLENDDKSYTIHDVLEISKATGVSVVLDYHHHRCHHEKPLTDVDIKAIVDSWSGVPKLHLSTGRRHLMDRSHADYIKAEDFHVLDSIMQAYEYDLMLEAKAKERALIRLRKVI
jgi:UV DNA damage endonuclease